MPRTPARTDETTPDMARVVVTADHVYCRSMRTATVAPTGR